MATTKLKVVRQLPMVTSKLPGTQPRPVLFVRIGWMRFYVGPVVGDPRPVGGGRYNERHIGHEVYNFRETGGCLSGFFQPPSSSNVIALERIDSGAADEDELDGVLVVFVARRPGGEQVIVGWYEDAEVFRQNVQGSTDRPPGYGYFCTAERRDCVLLPNEHRTFEIRSGKGGMGQSTVYYSLARDGSQKRFKWIKRALNFIDNYQGNDLLAKPDQENAAAVEEALAQSKGFRFDHTPNEKSALWNHATAVARTYFRDKGFNVKDASVFRPYDLLCRRGPTQLHVYVRGTTAEGEEIVLAANQVKHVRDLRNSSVLFILHSIRLNGKIASGGEQVVVDPWRIQRAHLTPVRYTYRLP